MRRLAIDNITSRIIYDAEKEAAVITKDAEERKEKILSDARKAAEEKREAFRTRGEAERASLVERNAAVAKIDAGKLILEEKQALIERCLSEAVNKVASMEETEYMKFLVDTALSLAPDGGELILNEKDRERFGEKLLDHLKDGEGKYSLSDEIRGMKGGLVVKKGNVYLNGSLEARIESLKNELVPEVAAILFGEGGDDGKEKDQ